MMKKLILIGEGCWFIDSFKFFIENGFSITVLKTNNSLPWFINNYTILKNLGANILHEDISAELLFNLNINKDTIILGGGNFGGECYSARIHENFVDISLEELNILYEISKFNYENNLGALVIRYFNGDTGFGSQSMVDLFTEKTKYIDVCIFDNSELRDFVLYNIPSLKNKKELLGWIETPLKRFVYHNNNKNYSYEYISMGRILNSYYHMDYGGLKILWYPKKYRGIKKIKQFFKKRKVFYKVAGNSSLSEIINDRILFYKHHKSVCFGLSHYYDFFCGGLDYYKNNKEFCWRLFGQQRPFVCGAWKEAYYAFVNNPSKDLAYLMNGIIPLISHTEHNVYKEMIEKKMAILIRKPEDIQAVLNMSTDEIQIYRDNIYQNRDLFTFDHVGNMIIDELKNKNV